MDAETAKLFDGSVSITDTIKRVSLPTFAKRPQHKSKDNKVSSLKQDANLVSHIFLSLQSRPDFDLDDFFKFENQKEPPSLSDQGMLRHGKKSDILQCMQIPKLSPTNDQTMKILDGAAIVHMVRPTKARNFQEYATRHVTPYVESSVAGTPITRLDIIWDTYPENNLKMQTQEKRGASTAYRTIVEGSTPIPSDWNKFLRNKDNKVDLFRCVGNAVVELSSNLADVAVYSTTKDNLAIGHPSRNPDFQNIMPCNHQEADTRMFLRLLDGAQRGHRKVYIRTVDNDIVAIALGHFANLGLAELWIGFGSRKNFQMIPVHAVANQLGPRKCLALPLFHSFTGCDTTSSFLGIGKKTAWAAWDAYPQLTDTLLALPDEPDLISLDSIHMERLERWTVIMYSKSCGCSRVNHARKQLFSHGKCTLEKIPPTQEALLQHTKRALHQAGYVWRQAREREQHIPDPSEWGWVLNEQTRVWSPRWTMLEDVSKACSLLFHCNCEKACKGNCKCGKAGLRCTVLCRCEGGCINND